MNNLVQSSPDTRDYIFSPTGVIKPEVDLRPLNEITESDYQQAVAVAWQDANWAKFLRYVFRVGSTKNDFLTLCKTLKFTKLSALTKWIVG